jgi:prevent-host-death family protein
MAKKRQAAYAVKSNRRPTVRVVSATEAKNRFGEVIREAYEADQQVIVEKGGLPVVAIISMADYEKLLSMSASTKPEQAINVSRARARDDAIRNVRRVLAEMHARVPNVPEKEVERDIQHAMDEVRRTRR